MIHTCFSIYFNPIYIYIKRALELAFQNNAETFSITIILTSFYQIILDIYKIEVFGVPNILLVLVMSNVLIDAHFGVVKSVKQSKEFLQKALLIKNDCPKKRALLKKYELKKFNPKKLQFTFFKCVTLLGYLFFAKKLLEAGAESSISSLLGFATGVLVRIPLGIFWYYDFKSIGDNTAYIYGKKAPIFRIVEKIFEPKINELFKNEKTE